MPKVRGTKSDGSIPTVDDKLVADTMTYPQTMARPSDTFDRAKPRMVGRGDENYQARMFHEDGPVSDPWEYANEMKAGFLSRRNQMLAVNAVQSLSRRTEYELCGVVQGSQAFLDNYGDQYTKQITAGRQKIFDADEQVTTEADYLTSYRADDVTNFNLLDVIAEINLYMGSKFEDANKAFVGANGSYYIRRNSKLQELAKIHMDLTANQLSNTIDNVLFKKIKGQTYKDDSVNSARVGYPGFGNMQADTWGSRTLKQMMVDVSVVLHDKTASTEWALFTAGDIGYTFTALTHPDHKDPTVPYVHTWDNRETGHMFSRLQQGICPIVNDFSNFVVVKNFCTVKV
jgi:hypothetical protein